MSSLLQNQPPTPRDAQTITDAIELDPNLAPLAEQLLRANDFRAPLGQWFIAVVGFGLAHYRYFAQFL